MIINIFIAAVLVVMIVSVCLVIVSEKRSDVRFDEDIARISDIVGKYEEFFVLEYLERTEKLSAEIIRNREKQTDYSLTLWAGIDGLSLNEDGTMEWIRHEEDEEPKPSSVYYSPTQHLDFSMVQSWHSGTQELCSSACQAPYNQIQVLQSQLQACCVQQQMQAQYSQIINALRSPACLQYPFYYPTIQSCFEKR